MSSAKKKVATRCDKTAGAMFVKSLSSVVDVLNTLPRPVEGKTGLPGRFGIDVSTLGSQHLNDRVDFRDCRLA